ncbi:MFS transporter [Selenomonadales bacterium OttesenSCG-928-I06]|nr:MFS transporter [Selenomonadales bacterium OttesenSCG-928-I06]
MNKKYIGVLAASHMTSDITQGALPAMLPFLIMIYSIDYQAAAGLIFASSFLSSIVQPVFGYMADKTSTSWFMSLGIFLACLGISAVGFLDNYWAIFVAVMISGIGGAIFHPEAARLVNKLAGKKKGSGIGLFSVGGNAGFTLGPIIAVSAITFFGLKGLSVFFIIGTAMAVFLLYYAPKMKKNIVAIENTNAQDVQNKPVLENDWKSFSKLTIIIIGRSIIFSGIITFIPLFWVNVLMQPTATGAAVLSILFAFGVVITLFGGMLSDKLGYNKTLIIFVSLIAPLLFMLIQTNNLMFATVLLIPIGFSVFAPYSAMVVLGQSYLAKSVGFASGITMGIALSIGGIVVPGLGWIADNYSLQQAMQILVYVALVISVFTFFLPKPKTAA